MLEADQSLVDLTQGLARTGEVRWIGVRPGRRQPMQALAEVWAEPSTGLAGDRYIKDGKRQVTLIQAEHLAVLAALLGWQEAPAPELLRRNLVVAGINLMALKGAHFRVGEVLLEGTGACHPCSRMEEVLGSGGYSAMRGHGGLTARIVEPGVIRLGAGVVPE